MHRNCKVGLIFLAGGQGRRFGGATPKQYNELKGKPLALHAFHNFQKCHEIDEFVVVCEPEFQKIFEGEAAITIKFAAPGERRQDSVANGFHMLSADVQLVCIHDAARPYSTKTMLIDVLEAAAAYGAAAAGMPIKYTLKECDASGVVVKTPDRSRFWEIQTPQALRYDVLKRGLAYAEEFGVTVTDDISLAELVGSVAKIVQGSYSNLKITTPEDLFVAEQLEAVHHVPL